MKTFFLIAVCLIIHSVHVHSQTTTNYYQYNRAGVPQKVGYSETRPAKNPYSTYIPAIDPYLYGAMLSKKQQEYEKNVTEVQSIISDLDEAVYILSQYDANVANQISNRIKAYVNSLNKKKVDYTDFNTVFNIKQQLKSFGMELFRHWNNFQSYTQNDAKTKNQSSFASKLDDTETQATIKKESIYSGIVEVYTCSPVLINPDVMSKHLVAACDGKITIIKKYDKVFYLVDYQGKRGYLYYGWIK